MQRKLCVDKNHEKKQQRQINFTYHIEATHTNLKLSKQTYLKLTRLITYDGIINQYLAWLLRHSYSCRIRLIAFSSVYQPLHRKQLLAYCLKWNKVIIVFLKEMVVTVDHVDSIDTIGPGILQ